MTQNRPCTRLERPVHMANPPSRNTRDMPICIVHHHNVISTSVAKRAVAQLGSALRSGRRGRGFKSRQPDNWTGLLRNQQSGFSFPVPTIKPSDRTAVNNPPHTATNHITASPRICWRTTVIYRSNQSIAALFLLTKLFQKISKTNVHFEVRWFEGLRKGTFQTPPLSRQRKEVRT